MTVNPNFWPIAIIVAMSLISVMWLIRRQDRIVKERTAPDGLSDTAHELNLAILAARGRGELWKSQFHRLDHHQQVHVLAREIYNRIHTQEAGPSFDSLPEQTTTQSEDETYTQLPYLNAARFALSLTLFT